MAMLNNQRVIPIEVIIPMSTIYIYTLVEYYKTTSLNPLLADEASRGLGSLKTPSAS